MSIHSKIREGRTRLGLTEQQFADRVGVTRSAVQQWEKEGGTAPRRKNQPLVAKTLGVTVSELMSEEAQKSNLGEKISSAVRATEKAASYLIDRAWPFDSLTKEQWSDINPEHRQVIENIAMQFYGADVNPRSHGLSRQ